MLTNEHSARRQPGQIVFHNHAAVDHVFLPGCMATGEKDADGNASMSIDLDDHLVDYVGLTLDPKHFVWGLAGTSSLAGARQMAYDAAKAKRKRFLEIEGRYQMDNFDRVRRGIDAQAAFASGYLHIDRLKADFRDKLKGYLLKIAARSYPNFDLDMHSEASLGDLLLDFPALLQDLFDADDRILMVVHRVRPSWNPSSRPGVAVCTMRRIKKRIVDVRVPILQGLTVRC